MYNYKFFSGWKEPDIKDHPKYSNLQNWGELPTDNYYIVRTRKNITGYSNNVKQLQAIYKRRYNTPGEFTMDDWVTVCKHYAPDNRCLCCGDVDYLIPDHIVPVSKGGSNWITNIQPICEQCNSKKRNLHNKDYRPDLGDWTLHNFPNAQTFPKS